MPIFEFDEMRDVREYKGNKLLDYWGYNPISFLPPIPVTPPVSNTTAKASS